MADPANAPALAAGLATRNFCNGGSRDAPQRDAEENQHRRMDEVGAKRPASQPRANRGEQDQRTQHPYLTPRQLLEQPAPGRRTTDGAVLCSLRYLL